MRTWRQVFMSLLILVGAAASQAAAHPVSRSQWLFEQLSAHPQFESTLYSDEALIMKQGERFYAAFAVVRSSKSPWVCAYAAAFDPSIGTQPGDYVFKPRYICNEWLELKPYPGFFEIKFPWCGGEVCPNPAIGVGNLRVRPDFDLTLDSLPLVLPVKIDGRIRNDLDPTLPPVTPFF